MIRNVTKGNIVISLSGREKGNYFVVSKVEGNYAFLVNGKTRTLTNPKKKNIKHLQIVCNDCKLDFKKVYDCDIIHTVNNYISLKNSLEEKK